MAEYGMNISDAKKKWNEDYQRTRTIWDTNQIGNRRIMRSIDKMDIRTSGGEDDMYEKDTNRLRGKNNNRMGLLNGSQEDREKCTECKKKENREKGLNKIGRRENSGPSELEEVKEILQQAIMRIGKLTDNIMKKD